MGDKSKIEWTEATWNPIVGCSVVSPGCTNCYAMRVAGQRLDGHSAVPHYKGTTQKSKAGPVWTGKVALAPEKTMTAPLRWRRPRKIFVNSMGDLFHENIPDEWIDRVFGIMAMSPQHTFQVLTKRAERMREWASGVPDARWPLPNVWLGVSAEDQQRADERIPCLRATPAAIRFLSIEPLLGPISLDLTGLNQVYRPIHWVIAGGESGPGARPMHPDWPRGIRDQCEAAGVPFFFKQWGEWLPWEPEHEPCWKAQNGRSEDSHVLFPTDFDNAPKWDDGLSYIVQDVSQAAFQRVGKENAGRLLDGREWSGMPEIANV